MNKPARIARAIGAVALLVVGGIHLEQYTVAHFSVIPTIGPLFLLNFIAATLLGLILLVPIRSSAGRPRLLADSLLALSGLGLSAGAFLALADRRLRELQKAVGARAIKATSTPATEV